MGLRLNVSRQRQSLVAFAACLSVAQAARADVNQSQATTTSNTAAGSVAASAPPVSDELPYGFSLALSGGLNLARPFGSLQFGRRFEAARHFETYLDYSYNATLSKYPFHVLGVGVRSYFAKWQYVEVFHQALLAAALSGTSNAVPRRDFGERLLGAFVTQGLGANFILGQGFRAGLTLETGYPVWLRSTLSVRYLF